MAMAAAASPPGAGPSRPAASLLPLLLLLTVWRADAFSSRASPFSHPVPPAASASALAAASGGMDAYAAQMAAMAGQGTTPEKDAPSGAPADAPAERAAAEMIDSSRRKSNAAAAVAVRPSDPSPVLVLATLDADTAVAALEASQARSVADIASAIPDLAVKPDASHSPATTGFTIGGHAVKLDASDAPGPANVAWLSDLCVDGRLSGLTVFCGPLADVPHLVSRCAVDEGGDRLEFFLDFRPRAYGAYDLRGPDGAYPGPEELGRKAFEYSGARRDFDTKFGTEEVVAFLEGVRAKFEGAVDGPGLGDEGLPELEKLTRGPLAIDVTMPLSSRNVDAVVEAREGAARIWLGWALDASHAHRPGAPVNGQYVYDTKYRINAYGALLEVYTKLFGQTEGEKLAAADSGPIDEAYVGGGS